MPLSKDQLVYGVKEPLIVDYYGDLYPSMALLLAAKSLNLGVEDIRITAGSSVQLGRLNIKTDGYSLMNTFFYHDEKFNGAFAIDSFFDVLQGKIPADKYKDKIVLIGATALGVGDSFVTPIIGCTPLCISHASPIRAGATP